MLYELKDTHLPKNSGVQSRFYRETIVHAKTPQPAHEKPANPELRAAQALAPRVNLCSYQSFNERYHSGNKDG